MSQEKKWTQGPWEVDESGDVIVKGSGAYVGYPPTEGTIASLNDGEYIENRNEADAHLIAAAPELYEAIELMLRDYHTEGCPDPSCLVCRASEAAERRARAALAKARGEA